MRSLLTLVCSAALLAAASAAELKVKITDPQSAAVAGAQVSLLAEHNAAVVEVQNTSGDGTAAFTGVTAGRYRLQVLAPGFSPANEHVSLPQDSVLTIKIQIATATEKVVVTATRSPVPEQDTAASVASLESPQLETMNSPSASDALRVMPGAVINTAGQRGGLASLFVRGGESRYNKVIVDDVMVNDPGGTFDFGVVPSYQIDRIELVRGADSTLYGSDAMTSVVQFFTRNGSTRTPELRFGADGGTFRSAHGYA